MFANWASRLPRIQSEYSIDHSVIGLILLMHGIGAVIAMPVTGWLINKHGSRIITSISAYFFGIFFMTIAWAPVSWTLCIPFFLMGVSTGILDVAMNAQAVKAEQILAKPIMTMFHALFSIGMVCGGLTGVLFTSLETGLKNHFGLMGVFSLLLLAFASRFLIRDHSTSGDSAAKVFAWPRGPIIGLGIIAFCCMMGEGAMSDWSTIYMKDILESSKTIQGFGLTAFAAMMTFGRLFGDKGRGIFGDRKMMLFGSFISITGMILVLLAISPAIAILGFGLVGLGLSNIVPIVYSLAGSFPGVAPGVGIAMSTTIGYSGFMMGPAIIGYLSDLFNLRIALIFLAILFIMMLLMILKYADHSRS